VANYNVDIYLKLVTQEAERALKSFENKLSRVENRQQRLNTAANRLFGVGGTGRAGAGVGAGVKASPGRSANDLSREARVLGQADERRIAANRLIRALNLKQLEDARKLQKIKTEINKVQQIKNDQLEREFRLRQKNLKAARRQRTAAEEQLKTDADKARAANERNRNRGLQSAALGVGFPLLFGGGAGSIAGGLLGSAGGFGGQILGSAIGAQLDAFFGNLVKIGNAFKDQDQILSTLIDQNLIYNREKRKELESLEKAGRSTLANARALQAFDEAFGIGSANQLSEFASESEKFGKIISDLTTELGIFVAGPLTEFLRRLNAPVQLDKARDRARNIRLAVATQRASAQGVSTETDFLGMVNDKFFKVIGNVEKEYNERLRELVTEQQRLLGRNVLTKEEQARIYEKVTKEFSGQLAVDFSETQKLLNTIESSNDKLERLSVYKSVLQITEQFRNTSEKADKAREQALDVVEAGEKRVADLRLALERKVEDMRLKTIAVENRILDEQAKQRIQSLKNELDGSVTSFALSLSASDPAAGLKIKLAEAAAKFELSLVEAEEKRSKIQRDAELKQKQFQLSILRLRLDTEAALSEIQIKTAERVEKIKANGRATDSVFAEGKFGMEKAMAKFRLDVIEAEAALQKIRLGSLADQGPLKKYFELLNKVISKSKTFIEQAKPPQNLEQAANVSTGVGSVSTSAFLEQAKQLQAAEKRLKEAYLKGTDTDVQQAGLELVKTLEQQTLSIKRQETPLKQRNEDLKKSKEISRLIAEGFKKEDASAIYAANAAYAERKELLDTNLAVATMFRDRLESLGNAEGVTRLNSLIGTLKTLIGETNQEAAKLQDSFQKISDVEKLGLDVAGIALNGIVDTLTVGITEADKFGESLQEMTKSILVAISKALILFSIQQALSALGGGEDNTQGVFSFLSRALSGKALGGPVSGNQPYLVGERGPELFVPGAQGNIVPNNAMGGANVTVNVDASGSSVEGDSEQAGQLGKMLGAAVQAELIKQKRPGGLLA